MYTKEKIKNKYAKLARYIEKKYYVDCSYDLRNAFYWPLNKYKCVFSLLGVTDNLENESIKILTTYISNFSDQKDEILPLKYIYFNQDDLEKNLWTLEIKILKKNDIVISENHINLDCSVKYNIKQPGSIDDIITILDLLSEKN